MTDPDYFSWCGGEVGDRPVVIAIPHCGRDYPSPLLANARVETAEIRRLEDRYIDVLAPGLAQAGYPVIVAHSPRAAIDLNRSPVIEENGARYSSGLFPEQISRAGAIWKRAWTRQERTQRITDIHTPYHAEISRALAKTRDVYGYAMLIDLHSMPRHAGRGWPASNDIVFGDRNGETASPSIINALVEECRKNGFSYARNSPYAGGYGVSFHGSPLKSVYAVQVEIARDLYLDQAGAPDPERVGPLSDLVLAMARAAAMAASDINVLHEAAE